MVDEPGNQGALVAQLKELNERSRTYARQFWQLPTAYLAAAGVSLTQIPAGRYTALRVGLVIIGVIGLFVCLHLMGISRAAKRCVDRIAEVEAKLSLPKSVEWGPLPLQALLALTLVSAIASILAGTYAYSYWPQEDLGAQLRRECDSIVREYLRSEDPPWPPQKYEPLTKLCIERRAGLGEKE
jgi:hypothetical protein